MRLLFAVILVFAALNAWEAATSSTNCLGKYGLQFVNKLLGKLTSSKYFTADDKIVQMIANDIGQCAANGDALPDVVSVLSSNSDQYQSCVMSTKTSLAPTLLSFMSCVSDCDETGYSEYLTGTLLQALQNILPKPYQKCIANVPKMISNGKALCTRAEAVSQVAVAVVTDDLIEKVVNETMKRSCSCTWTKCVRPVITQGILNISRYIKTTKFLLPNCPSKAYGEK